MIICPCCGFEIVDERSVRGGKVGGRARWQGVSKQQREKWARAAARARWDKQVPAV